MKITVTNENSHMIIALEGRLDTNTAPELQTVVTNLDGVTALTIDLKDLEYISSAGLRVLLLAQKTMNKQGTMEVVHVNEVVNEIFEVTGFTDVLTIK